MDPSTTGATIETWVGGTGNSAKLQNVLTKPAAVELICKSNIAIEALAGSDAAFDLVKNNATIMAAIVNNTTALNNLWAMPTSSRRAAFFASETAFRAMAKSPIGMAHLATSSTAWSSYTSATLLTSIQVPTMTNYDAPSGHILYSSQFDANNASAIRAFDNDTTKEWRSASTGSLGQWLEYVFDTPVFIHTFTLKNGTSKDTNVYLFDVQYKDPTTGAWITSYTGIASTTSTTTQEFKIQGGVSRHWRLYINGSKTRTGSVYADRINFIGFEW